MKYFCKTCGKTNLYEKIPLNYCGYCGQSFIIGSNLNVVTTKQSEEIINKESFQIKNKKIKPSFTLQTYNLQSTKISELIAQNPNNQENYNKIEMTTENENKNIEKSKDDILEQFKMEASLSRDFGKN
jgi:hypothetical protein